MTTPARRGPRAIAHRLARTLPTVGRRRRQDGEAAADVALDCGWGRLIFGQTFEEAAKVAETLRSEGPDLRDIATYLSDPHVVIAHAPQELFLDPSHTYRLWLNQYRSAPNPPRGFAIRRIATQADAEAINRIYATRQMVQPPADFMRRKRHSRVLVYLVAEDHQTGDILGTVTGVDHVALFGDAEGGSSLWCLAVDPQCPHPGVGEALVRHLAERFQARGRAFMDLSVMHDNEQAIALYEKLGFQRIQTFTVKRKNSFNETLFIGPSLDHGLNPYATIIVNEARRRGIAVDILDEEAGYFRLIHGGRSIVCRESLSELTSAIAMSRCDDKAVTRRVLTGAGLRMPEQVTAGDAEEERAFLARHGRIVVKPARGEQGHGISVDLRTPEDMERAVAEARNHCPTILLEEFVEGQDLRIVVIDHRVVAAAVRRPPQVTGTGRHSLRELIEKQSRRREAATGGESRIPIDQEAERCLREAGYTLEDVLPEGATVTVRRASNLHAGGTIHDVTDDLHPELRRAAEEASRALAIPVVGLDFMVPDVAGPDYAIIEANERPGLANHEPQPTAERFVDLLFPQTAADRAARHAP